MEGDVSWCAVLAHHAERSPDRPMLVFDGHTTTYGDMAARSAALAAGLQARGLGPGSVVATSDQWVSLRRSSNGKSNRVASIWVVSSMDTRSTQSKVSPAHRGGPGRPGLFGQCVDRPIGGYSPSPVTLAVVGG